MLRKSARLRAGDLTCKGNPTKVSLAYIPFLAIYRSAHGQQNLWAITKKYDHPLGGRIFLERRFCAAKSVACGRVIEREWGNPQRVPPHTPPSLRYARVRTTKPEGNHKKKNHPLGGFFWNVADRVELAASTGAQRGEPFRRGRRPRRPVSAAVPRWERIPTLLRAAKQRALGVLLGMTGVWVYRHAATIRQDGVSFLTVPGETPASGRAAPPTPRRSAPAGRPGRR